MATQKKTSTQTYELVALQAIRRKGVGKPVFELGAPVATIETAHGLNFVADAINANLAEDRKGKVEMNLDLQRRRPGGGPPELFKADATIGTAKFDKGAGSLAQVCAWLRGGLIGEAKKKKPPAGK